MMKQDNVDYKELAQWIIDRAKAAGADQSFVSLSKNRSVSISYRDHKLEELKEATQASLSLQLYVDHRYSVNSTNDLRKESLAPFIDEAVAGTRYLSQDMYRELTDPSYYPKGADIDLELVDEKYEQLETEKRLQIVKEIEAAAMDVSPHLITASSYISDGVSESLSMNSLGFLGVSKSTYYAVGAGATVKDGDSGRPEDYSSAVTRYFKDLPTLAPLGSEAVKKAERKMGQRKIASGSYLTLIENRTAGRMVGVLLGPLSGRAIQQKSSFLEGKKGQQITSSKFTLTDDPFIKKGLASRLFDGDGIAARKRNIIENGVLQEYLIDNYYGRKLGMAPTGASTSNLRPNYGTRSFDEIIKDIQKGIVITGFIGGNSNPTTGDFSFGIVGYLVENGVMVHPVNEMNITGNVLGFWKNLEEIGNDPYQYSSLQMPAMVFKDVQFSGL